MLFLNTATNGARLFLVIKCVPPNASIANYCYFNFSLIYSISPF